MADVLGAEPMAALDRMRENLAAVGTADEFATVYRELIATSHVVREPLQAAWDEAEYEGGAGLPKEMFTDHPFYAQSWGAEGTAVLVVVTYPPLRERARATPGLADDSYLDLVELMYPEDARAQGWSVLQDRNWDYGGCSPLGTGTHQRILQAADRARSSGDLFAEEIAAIRSDVLRDILQDNEYFPYCTGLDVPTPHDKIRAELDAILAGVELSDDERTKLQERRKARFGG